MTIRGIATKSVIISTGIIKGSGFWTSYVLDITGPAWCYILIRGQYKSRSAKFLTIRFSPELAFLLIIGICFIVETLQFFKVYTSTFDLYDLLAYFSGTFIVYLVDKYFNLRFNKKL